MLKSVFAIAIFGLLLVVLVIAYRPVRQEPLPAVSTAAIQNIPLQSQALSRTVPTLKVPVAGSTNVAPQSVKALRPNTANDSVTASPLTADAEKDLTKGMQLNVDKDWGMEVSVDSREGSDYGKRIENPTPSPERRLETVGPSVTFERKF